MARRHSEDAVSAPAATVRCRVLREFAHYLSGSKQDEAEGAEIDIPRDVAERWVAAGHVEYVAAE